MGIEAASDEHLRIRNPWPDEAIAVLSAATGARVETVAPDQVVIFQAKAGERYLLERTSHETASLPFASIGGQPANVAKSLGNVQIGLFAKNP